MKFINLYDYPYTLDQMAESVRFIINSINDGEHEPSLRYLEIKDGITAPVTASFASLYIDTADGDLKVRFANGYTRVIGADS